MQEFFVVRRLLRIHVNRGLCDFAALQCLNKRGLADHAAARAVYQPRTVLHYVELRLVDHVTRVGRLGQMQRDYVALRQHLVQFEHRHVQRLEFVRYQIQPPLGRQDFHTERLAAFDYFAADAACADYADGLAEKFRAHKALLLPFALFHRGGRVVHPARQSEHMGDCEFGDGDGRSAGGVDHGDALFLRDANVYVIQADSAASDGLEVLSGLDGGLADLGGAADDDGVIRLDEGGEVFRGHTGLHGDFVTGVFEFLYTLLGDRVANQDFHIWLSKILLVRGSG